MRSARSGAVKIEAPMLTCEHLTVPLPDGLTVAGVSMDKPIDP